MPYNLLMPEEQSRPPWWSVLWQRRWWIALAMLFILVWWLVPPLLYRHTGAAKDAQLKAITDTRTALLAGLIGVGALLTFWLNSRVYRITVRTLEVTEQGHITERYTKAIEQLGSDKLDVRLGGIYALERIATDSERDHPTVVEVLSAFVREHSDPASPPPTPGPGPRPPTTDVQAAVTVLGRLPQRKDVSRGNLSTAHLEGADLSGAYLQGAILRETNLEGAELAEAHLEGADLYFANLRGAQLLGTNLQEATLEETDLYGANLHGANLHGAKLYFANLDGADLLEAHLERADLSVTRGLVPEQLDRAIRDNKTQLPPELRPPTTHATPRPVGGQPPPGEQL